MLPTYPFTPADPKRNPPKYHVQAMSLHGAIGVVYWDGEMWKQIARTDDMTAAKVLADNIAALIAAVRMSVEPDKAPSPDAWPAYAAALTDGTDIDEAPELLDPLFADIHDNAFHAAKALLRLSNALNATARREEDKAEAR